ncbi:Do family serine endopeptidase [Alkalilimnicola sp. S0819]|uniref:Do family serine endopeptidase n=1 Tax=Alkalilimnicola sp. S0819 TaxID=2613922 RepID=UPI0012619B8A|nr:Do family serine endopeptidase [Alkalilimnicola sp. S0819]KAB7623836.1 Do family serine endopeptidase [Alkalilimnicola sp. S0819]MPQ16712.1 Do family serine endopeptidase [Alkalilimnicola sp. S0819]
MTSRRLLRFLFSYALVGALVAVGLMYWLPDLMAPERPVVQVKEAPGREPAPGLGSGPVSYSAAVEQAAPAVVNIFTSKTVSASRNPLLDDPLFRRFFGDRRPENRSRNVASLGSGVIISRDGFVLTNNHVIDGADQIRVALADGRIAEARLTGSDPESDLAVLKIELQELPVITLGRSNETRVGDVALAIGNPFGVGQTVTQGIVSATGRNKLGINTFENFIQTDAAINPGNSGGALINAHGELIGINTAIFSRTGGSLGIGFAIPTELARGVMENIIEHGRVIRGWVGIQVQEMSPQLAESFGLAHVRGVVLAGVLRGGPAQEAGLSPGDVVLEIDGESITEAGQLLRLITQRKPGEQIHIQALRQGRTFETDVTVAVRPADLAP